MSNEKKIKILECIRQAKIGGGESYLLGLVENIDRSRFEPIVLAFTDGPMINRLESAGIKTYVIPTEKPFDVSIWGRVKQLAAKEKVNLVHAHGTRANSNVFWAAKKLGLPLVYTCHAWSFHPDQNYLVKKIRIASERFLTGKANVNICGSIANGKQGVSLFPGYEPVIIYNSIDPKKFNPHGVYRDIRAELGISKTSTVVTSIARFTVQKQPLKLLEAFRSIAKDFDDVVLLMVGDGEEKAEAINRVNEWGLGKRVIFQSFREDIPDVLNAADIFVLPSLWEAFPIALLEAMSMGKAVIATNVDGTPEIIEHNRNGILIPVDNLVKHIYENLSLLIKDLTLRKRLQTIAVQTIYGRYNLETLARENEKIYERLA